MQEKFVTLGEIMLRLRAPGFERFMQSPSFEATFGGGEANVAAALSLFGADAAFITALPDNAVADACIRQLRGYGVDTSKIVRQGDRIGIYYLECGADQRPSSVIYDRAGSSFSAAGVEDFHLDEAFSGKTHLHITGITPAVSQSAADLSLASVRLAKKLGMTVSCDLNFRKNLWKYGVSASEFMPKLMEYTDTVIANEEDIQKSLGIQSDADVTSGVLTCESYKALAEKLVRAYPNISRVAITLRESKSASHNNWSACLYSHGSFYVSRKYEIRHIVDRVGGGDSFSAGLLYGLSAYRDDREALEFAAAASCLKHSVIGDICLVRADEVEKLMRGDGSGRVRR